MLRTHLRRAPVAVLVVVVTSASIAALISHALGGSADIPSNASHPGQVLAPLQSSEPSSITVSYPIELPTGYQETTGLASDSSGSTIWFFSQGEVSGTPIESLFSWNVATATLSTFAVPNTNGSLDAFGRTPMIVDSSGNVWVGINTTVVEFDPTVHSFTSVLLPVVSVGAEGSGLPQYPPVPGALAGEDNGIDSLALAPNGDIAVSRAFATELQLVTPKTDAISTIPLPANTAIAGLGQGDLASSGGVIAATLYSSTSVHELGLYIDGQWAINSGPCATYASTFSGTELVVSGPSCIAYANETLSSSSMSLATHTIPGISFNSPTMALNASTILVALPTSPMAFDRSAGLTQFSLGDVYENPSGNPIGSRTQLGESPVSIGIATWTQNNGVWFVPKQTGQAIGVIHATSTS